jgi:hypothetical protein
MVGPWLWTATKGHAPLLRDGQNTGLYTLFKPTKFDDRYSQAEGHMEQAAGKPAHNGHLPADRAWSLMVQHCNNYRPPERWHENDATEARMRAATRSVGGWREIGKIDDYSRGRVMKAWCQAYTEARP